MIGELAILAWLCLIVYVIWLLASAKDYVALSGGEATFLWKLHKSQAQCSSTKFETIRHKKRAVGFRCACGYKHLSKRLITQHDQRSKLLEVLRKNEWPCSHEPFYLVRSE